MWKKTLTITEYVNRFSGLIAGLAVFVMFCVIVYDVFMRYFFVRPTAWAVDVGTMLMLPATYIAGAMVLRRGGHIRVDLVISRIGGVRRRIMEFFSHICALAFSLLITWRGWIIFFEFYHKNKITEMAMLPLYPAAIFIALGASLLLIESIIRIVEDLRLLMVKEPAGHG